eukprot:6476680-Amphidinium_carterae.5
MKSSRRVCLLDSQLAASRSGCTGQACITMQTSICREASPVLSRSSYAWTRNHATKKLRRRCNSYM